MRIPPVVNIVLLVLGATAFYTLVGQMVPQKEVPAPEVVEIATDVSTEEMVEIGRGIAEGKGACLTCHTIGQSGALRFPDLEGIGARAETRIPGMSGLEYLAQSLYEPDVYVVEGFNPGMPAIDKPPIQLTHGEILTVIAYMQSLGGTPSVTMETKHSYNRDDGVEPVAVVEQPSAEVAQAPAASLGEAYFEQYGCGQCHATPPGDRLGRDAILASILDPHNVASLAEADRMRKKQAMERAGVYDRATLQEIQSIVDFLMEPRATQ